MASALCPHGWPWFEECPYCFQELWVELDDAVLLSGYGNLVAASRAILGTAHVGPASVDLPPAGDAEWFLLDTTPRLPLRLRWVEEAVVFGVLPDGGRQADWDSHQPASGMAHPSVGKE